jgi:TonB family protein
MTLQTKGFGWSIGIHGLIILIVAIIQFSADSPSRIAVIDFSLADADRQIAPHSGKEPRQKAEYHSRPAIKKIIEQAVPSLDAQKTQPAKVSFSGKEISTPVPEMPQDLNPTHTAGFSQPASAAGSGGGSAGSEGIGEAGQQVEATYLKEHFAYIRDRITRSICYPDTARRMGRHGRVKIAFVICEDGSVADVRVIESCGCSMLDQNTVDTVKKVAPFPCPPVRAEIRMAINYQLN